MHAYQEDVGPQDFVIVGQSPSRGLWHRAPRPRGAVCVEIQREGLANPLARHLVGDLHGSVLSALEVAT